MTNVVQEREPSNSRKRVALHEASHAVAARAYGLPVDFAEVSDGFSGRVVYHRHNDAWARTVVALAGPLGELAFCKDEGGGDRDLERAHGYAREVDLENNDEVMREARTAALKIVRDNRAVISALADVLERKGKLSGAEIDAVIGNVTPGPVAPNMTPIERARRDAARRRARRDYEGAAFIEKWIKQQERAR